MVSKNYYRIGYPVLYQAIELSKVIGQRYLEPVLLLVLPNVFFVWIRGLVQRWSRSGILDLMSTDLL